VPMGSRVVDDIMFSSCLGYTIFYPIDQESQGHKMSVVLMTPHNGQRGLKEIVMFKILFLS